MPDRRSLYIGRSGELAVLSEFLSRGYNAATPEIDIGEDVFVIEDGSEGYWPVQVKTASAEERSDGSCRAQFQFRRDQLVKTPNVELTYILVLRRNKQWASFLIIPRRKLSEMYELGNLGAQQGLLLTWEFVYDREIIRCQQADFTKFESDWETQWPEILDKTL
ncbi:MAG TPA: hypothetical protein VG537_07935 [Candidatus Kapabacteria bacterium]|jgi:hypothetical protein|nr:hypothetical protein [Candidatus Kapabacteria bacterium]